MPALAIMCPAGLGDALVAVQITFRRTMGADVGLKPRMDMVTHHTAVAGDLAMTRSQGLIRGTDRDGRPTKVHHHGMEVHRRLPDGTWVLFMDHPSGADPGWAVETPPRTD